MKVNMKKYLLNHLLGATTKQTSCGGQVITAPKTYAGDIKAFANSRSLRGTYFHFANA
jgi:hypothetical protein